jgi:hypothetical protein
MKETGIVFGSAAYLEKKFDDVDNAVVSTRSAAAKEIKALVKSKSTNKDRMYAFRVLKVKGKFDGQKYESYVAHISLGLNGAGKESDYLAALKRLTDTGKFHVIDACIDAIDDLWDFLVTWKK